jgi:hypothetical protein
MYAARRTPVEPPNPSGLCLCGCGQPTLIAKTTRLKWHEVKGLPVRYVRGHQMRGKRGEATSSWKGGRWIGKQGYVFVYRPEHTEADRDGYVYEHRLVAEEKAGRPLTRSERVHHLNGIKDDNRPENIVVLPTQSAHMKLHSDTPQWAGFRAFHGDGKKGAQARWGKRSNASDTSADRQ